MNNRETMPIPPGGTSKYRPLAEAIINSYRKGDAVRITAEEHKKLSAVQTQVYRLLNHELGGFPSFRLQTVRAAGSTDRLVWILSYDEAVKGLRRDASRANSPNQSGHEAVLAEEEVHE